MHFEALVLFLPFLRKQKLVGKEGDDREDEKPEEAEELAKAAQGVVAKEAAILDNILNNHSYERPWVDELLTKTGCTTE